MDKRDTLSQSEIKLTSKKQLVVAIVVTYNSEAFLTKCLNSLLQSYFYQVASNSFADLIRNNLQPVYFVPFVNAAIWLISRKCIQEVGGFDPLFFMYAEDDDYCCRLRLHGLHIGIVPTAHAYHAR